ncbi:MAG: hypothetical protein R3308_02255, partial [Thiohalobacterales bacterium]|nr:hypothetical protein [Thiohalobacterales bacterium]
MTNTEQTGCCSLHADEGHGRQAGHTLYTGLLLLLAGMLTSLSSSSLLAMTNGNGWIDEALQSIAGIRQAVERYDAVTGTPDQLTGWIGELSSLRLQAQKCVDAKIENLEKLRQSADHGTAVEKAAADTTETPGSEIRDRLALLEGQLQNCRILLIDAGLTIDQIRQIQTDILKTHLFGHGPNIWEVALLNLQQLGGLYPIAKTLLLDRLQLGRMKPVQWLFLVVIVAAAIALGIWWRRRILTGLPQDRTGDYTLALMTSLQSCSARILPLILPLALAAVWLFYVLPGKPVAPSVVLLIALLVFMAGSLIIRVFLNPCPPARHFIDADPVYSRALGKHLHGLLVLLLVAVLFYGLGIREILTNEHWYMARAVFISMTVIILLWLVMAMRRAPAPFSSAKLRGLLFLVLLTSLGAELTGYRNLSVYLLGGLVGTSILAIVVWVANMLVLDLFDGLDEGRLDWEKRLRTNLRLAPDEPVPGLIWLRLLTTLTIWLVFIAGLFVLWGYDESVWRVLREGFTGGFQVAGMQITPLNLIIANAVFALLVTLVRWIRNEVLPGWVNRTRVSHGA